MKPEIEETTNNHSPKFSAFAYSLLTDILANAAHPARMNLRLVEQLRELTGARLVVLAHQRELEGGYELVAFDPGRRRSTAESPAMMALANLTHELDSPTLWERGNAPPAAEALLAESLPGPAVAVPLRVGRKHVGALLLFGLLHEHSLDQVIDVLGTLSHAVALVLRNAALYEDQEATIAARTRELAESEERLAVTLRSIGDAVISTDIQGNVILMNPVAAELTGWGEAEAIGKPLAEVFPIINEQTRQSVEDPVARVLRQGLVVGLANHTLLIAKDGKEIPIADSGAPIRTTQGEVTGVVLVFRDQTEERAAQNALRESEAKFRSVVESSPLGMHMYHLESDGRLVFIGANRAADRILGVDNSQFIGKTIEEAFPPLAATEVPERYRRAAAQGESWATEQIVYEDEKIAGAFEVHAFQTEPAKMVAMFLDITDRKRAEEALRESENLLQQMAANYPNSYISIIEKDLTVGFTAGQEFSKQNLDPAQFVGLTLEQVFGDQTDIVREHYKKTFEGEEQSFELSVNEQYQHYRTVPLYADDGSIPRILAVVENITERVRAEQALRKSEKKYRELVELAQEGIWVIDKDSFTTFVNPSMAKILGYTPAEMQGKTLFSFMDEKGIEIAKVNLERRKRGIKEQHDFEFIGKDGQRILATLATAPIMDEAGHYKGAIAGVLDITERKHLERELRELNAELENRVAERTASLNIMVNVMAGREVRMAELKEVIKKLRAQLQAAGLQPVANDPLLTNDE